MAFVNAAIKASWGLGLTCMVAIGLLSFYFVRNRPASPEVQVGRTQPFNVHGWVVYLTRGERITVNAFIGVLFGAVIVATLLFVFGCAKGYIDFGQGVNADKRGGVE
jgi:hypothetical protein